MKIFTSALFDIWQLNSQNVKFTMALRMATIGSIVMNKSSYQLSNPNNICDTNVKVIVKINNWDDGFKSFGVRLAFH